MKTFVFVSILMLAAALVAQQPASQDNPPSSPSQATATAQVQQDIQQAWQSESDLSKAKLNAQVSGGAITLTGTVANEDQHQKALQVATSHANGMKIVDKIKVQPQ
jgi:osmotically-inducible protein OsmY